MKTILGNATVVLLSRLVLGTFFIVASIDKIGFPDAFAANIFAYKLVPAIFVNVAAVFLPWLELLTGIFLVAGVRVRSSAAIVAFLLAVFMVAMSIALFRELKIDCGCFGKDHATPVTWARVLEDAGLLVLALHLLAYPRSRFSLEHAQDAAGAGAPPAEMH
jgi:uncharacterized membrane protein YphA (DoxX/SURF4 family)